MRNYPPSFSDQKRLNRYCSQCGLMNPPQNNFCFSCGGACPPNPQRKSFSSAKILLPIITIASFIGLCVFCGLIGSIKNRNQVSQVSNQTPVSLVSNRREPRKTSPTAFVKDDSAKSEKDAEIISENANLRESGNSKGKVIGTLPEGETVGVIKQKGAWFYVSSSLGKGWLHGNTIRLNDTESVIQPKSTPYIIKTTPTPQVESRNPTGATALCRDGTLSYSAHRRGTCSHHGGVSVWY